MLEYLKVNLSLLLDLFANLRSMLNTEGLLSTAASRILSCSSCIGRNKALEDELVPGTFKPRPQEELPAPPVPGAMSFSAFSNGASPFMAFARSGSDYDHVQL